MHHTPVMFREVMQVIKPNDQSLILDCTFGYGGHTKGFLDYGASVIGIDRDINSVQLGSYMSFSRLKVFQSKFSQIAYRFYPQRFDAIFFDLGLSSPQINNPARGMSFKINGKLDMRMGLNSFSAYDFVNYASESFIADIIYKYGEERKSRRIANFIVRNRQIKNIETTLELAKLVEMAIGGSRKVHAATRTFQAIRIFVNNELGEISSGLKQVKDLLKYNGIICGISFHSLEDRVLKMHRINKRKGNMVVPTLDEIARNPRSRSAKLRWQRLE